MRKPVTWVLIQEKIRICLCLFRMTATINFFLNGTPKIHGSLIDRNGWSEHLLAAGFKTEFLVLCPRHLNLHSTIIYGSPINKTAGPCNVSQVKAPSEKQLIPFYNNFRWYMIELCYLEHNAATVNKLYFCIGFLLKKNLLRKSNILVESHDWSGPMVKQFRGLILNH